MNYFWRNNVCRTEIIEVLKMVYWMLTNGSSRLPGQSGNSELPVGRKYSFLCIRAVWMNVHHVPTLPSYACPDFLSVEQIIWYRCTIFHSLPHEQFLSDFHIVNSLHCKRFTNPYSTNDCAVLLLCIAFLISSCMFRLNSHHHEVGAHARTNTHTHIYIHTHTYTECPRRNGQNSGECSLWWTIPI